MRKRDYTERAEQARIPAALLNIGDESDQDLDYNEHLRMRY